jgi:23S rRNA (adenine2503-C2)-methyltransferase
MAERPALYDLTHAELSALVAGWGEPSFRANQIWRWLYKSFASDFAEMANLPRELRTRLEAETRLKLLEPEAQEISSTGQTRKVLFHLHDGNAIESVLMRNQDRRTACISTQAGCGMGCTFCATGQGGLTRNLSAGEIVAQVIHFAREIRDARIEQAQEDGTRAALGAHPISNVVLMGMGEPLANYQATLQATKALIDPRGYGLGARRITLSSVGLVPGIRRLAEAAIPINLAVSLHAANDELRNKLVPVNQTYPLADLLAAVRDYVDTTGRRVTFEYALISGINDAPRQARELAALLHGLLCHVNLIALNPTPGSPQRPSSPARVNAFHAELEGAGIPVTVRMRRGIEIEAGCGQLRQRQKRIAAR